MESKTLFALLGIAVIAVATVGLGASLATTSTLNRIGGDDNVVIAAARANITGIAWTEEVAADGVVEVDTITFTVGNEDASNSHTFEVCAVLEGPASTYSPAAAAPPECSTTGSIAASSTQAGVTIAFTTAVDANDLVDISFSVEETA